MPTNAQNLRKAAVFIRSLDADTAAGMLAQLAPEEANEVRAAIRSLGALDPEEQADVAAEFRRAAPLANQAASHGVELELSAAADSFDAPLSRLQPGAKRFDFLDEAPVEALAQFLVREHVQTIAVVLSYLAPRRAAAVLALLPATLQADTIERLSALGDTDPDSLRVVERELSAWVTQRTSGRAGNARRSDAVMSILAAADENSRDQILVSLKTHKAPLAKQLAPLLPMSRGKGEPFAKPASPRNTQAMGLGTRDWGQEGKSARKTSTHAPQPPAPSPQPPASRPQPPAPRFAFDDLVLLSAAELAALLRDVDANVLVLALAGSSDELVDRICQPMPRRTAKAFRRQLGRLGPTRLSDVEAAQRLVAAAAARRLTDNQTRTAYRVPGVEALPSPQSVEQLGAR